MIHQEIALYKVSTELLYESDKIERLSAIQEQNPGNYPRIHRDRENRAQDETQQLFEELAPFGVMQFIRSGRIAITRSIIEKLSEFLKVRDSLLEQVD
jgi:acetolactate synthase-1/3 small subunit